MGAAGDARAPAPDWGWAGKLCNGDMMTGLRPSPLPSACPLAVKPEQLARARDRKSIRTSGETRRPVPHPNRQWRGPQSGQVLAPGRRRPQLPLPLPHLLPPPPSPTLRPHCPYCPQWPGPPSVYDPRLQVSATRRSVPAPL